VGEKLLKVSLPLPRQIRAIGMLPVSQKVLHFCAYTWLVLLALLANQRRPRLRGRSLHDITGCGFGVWSEAGTWPVVRNP
jgi:hypothetical protein